MSDLTEAASEAMGIPTALVERSAAARAAESDSDIDAVLTAWTGGEPAPSPAPKAAEEPEPEAEPEPADDGAAPEPADDGAVPEPVAAAVAVAEAPEPEPVPAAPVSEPEPEEDLEPVPLGTRLRTAVRVGAWTGAALGLVGFFMASGSWAPTAAVLAETGPVVLVNSTSVLVGVALVSIAFGAVVASLSRTAAAWSNPAMQLSSSKTSTAWIGAGVGLILGLVAGAALSGLGTTVEGSEGTIQLPVLATLAVVLLGGAALGALTAAVPQLLGTPVALGEESEEEIEAVKSRLGGAMSIPMAAALLLVTLVIPFGYMLIQSNHLGENGAAIIAILTAGGILGFATLAGGRPEMRITFGEIMVAVAGIGTVLIIILAVLFYTGQDDEHDTGGEEAAGVVLIL